MKIVFLGTSLFAVPALHALLHSDRHDVVAVYTQPPRPAGRGQKLKTSPVHAFADAHGIPIHTPISLKSPEEQKIFADHGADASVVAAYGLLLPQAILDAQKSGCINIHPSDLPRWRGAAPLQRTIMAGDTQTAMCIMQMEAGLDTGPILLRQPVAIPPGTTTGMLHEEMSRLGAVCLLQVLDELPNLSPQAQSAEGVTYAAKIDKAEARIDWHLPALQIQRLVLGLNPAPCAYFLHAGEAIKIFRGEVVNGQSSPGTLIAPDVVACGEGALRLTEIQRPGKKPQGMAEALRGWSIPPGTRLE